MARHLPIDTKAHDAARVLRTPGSINSKSKRRVHYWIRADAKGKGFMYTLPELAKSLGIASPGASLPGSMEALAEKPQYRKVKRPGTAPARKAGKLKLNAQRASDLLTIQAWRGGFLKRGAKYDNNGHTSHGRAAHLKLYANFLRGAGMDKGEALNKLREMAANMKPAYPSDSPQDDPPVESLLENEYTSVKSRRWANKTLCPLLGIDSDIAQVLELKTIKPDEMHKQEHDERPTQKEIADERREWLRQYTIANMAPPGGWTGKLALNAYKAFAPQHLADTINNSVTAHTDLNTIGIKTHKPGRRRKQPTE